MYVMGEITLNKKTVLKLVKQAYLGAAKEDEIKNKLAYKEIIFSWNVKDADIWFTIELKNGKVFVKEGKAENSDMIFSNETLAQFHKGNIEEITGREMKDSGEFGWSGNDKYIKHISVLCKHMREHYKQIALTM